MSRELQRPLQTVDECVAELLGLVTRHPTPEEGGHVFEHVPRVRVEEASEGGIARELAQNSQFQLPVVGAQEDVTCNWVSEKFTACMCVGTRRTRRSHHYRANRVLSRYWLLA